MSETLIHIINHMDFGGAQKIVYSLIEGLNKKFRVVLICKLGFYSRALDSNENVIVVDRSKLSVLQLYHLFNSFREKSSRLIVHTHNRGDILFKYFLKRDDLHVHTFHSAYPNKNFIY